MGVLQELLYSGVLQVTDLNLMNVFAVMASSAMVAVASVLLRTVLLYTVLAAVGLFGAASSADAAIKSKHQYCIIGAGPAGLQMGYFMKKARRDYIILEKNTYPG